MKINFRKTKILGKIADNKSEPDFLKSLFDAGVDVAWLNTAHQGEDDTKIVIDKIRSIAPHMGIMIDTKGPEVRTKGIEEPFTVTAGEHVYFSGNTEYKKDGATTIHVDYPNFHNEVPAGTVILYDDASIGFTVVEKEGDALKCLVQNSGTIKKKKSINTPNVHIELPALTEKDKGFIRFCGTHNVEYITHSFVRSKQDLMDIKEITDQFPGYKPFVVSKLENREGFENVEEILDNSQGLMVARGDLGAEVPLREMPFMQKKMVEAALKKGKSCIVATQVLDSMIKNPRPTRAEVLDIANAILDGSGAVSMSGETAYGDYPIEATTLMGDVMAYTESKIEELTHYPHTPTVSTPEFDFAKQVVAEAKKAGAKAILAPVDNADLHIALSAYRPSCVAVVGSSSEMLTRQLCLYYALRSMYLPEVTLTAMLANIDAGTFAADDMVTVVTALGEYKTVRFSELA